MRFSRELVSLSKKHVTEGIISLLVVMSTPTPSSPPYSISSSSTLHMVTELIKFPSAFFLPFTASHYVSLVDFLLPSHRLTDTRGTWLQMLMVMTLTVVYDKSVSSWVHPVNRLN